MKQNVLALIALSLVLNISHAGAQSQWLGTSIPTLTPGNCTIQGGQISLAEMTGDSWRTISANSNSAGLNLFVGTDTANTTISMFASNHPTSPGMIQFISSANSGLSIATKIYSFLNYDGGSFSELMTINRNGDAYMAHDLTVNNNQIVNSNCTIHGGQLSLARLSGIDNWRTISANSNSAGLNLFVGTDTANTTISMFASGHPTSPGMIQFISSASSIHPLTTKIYSFLNYDGSTYSELMTINKNGDAYLAHDLTVNNNQIVNNNCTVHGGQLNLARLTGADTWRSISANSNSAGLNIFAGTDTANTSISLFAMNHPTFPGEIQFISSTSTSVPAVKSYSFLNYNGGGTYSELMTINKNGDANITNNLFVNGGSINISIPGIGYRSINANSTTTGLNIFANHDGTNTSILLNSNGASINPGQIGFISSSVISANNAYLFQNYSGSSTGPGIYTTLMAIQQCGKVVIGDTLITGGLPNPTPDGYLLYVAKGILTEKLKVANAGDPPNWSDFVFNKNYELMPLNKVESYVKTNKHLPEIPSANEVAKEGIDVASMDAKLLQKIEELTLYIIQLQKEVDELKQKN